jgi:phosphohistidine phosphatase
MKTVFFIRHARAEKNADIPDAARTLDSRGKAEIAEMVDRLRGKIKPDVVVASTAIRAVETATALASGLGIAENTILKRQMLYDSPETALASIFKSLASKHNSVAIVGHNPSMSALASGFAPEFREEIPTCGIVGIAFGVSTWKEVMNAVGTVVFMDEPGEVPQSKRYRLMRRELGSELAEVIGTSLRMRNPDSADELGDTVCRAAEKIARKFVKSIRSRDRKAKKRHSCTCSGDPDASIPKSDTVECAMDETTGDCR